ncbi:MAG: phosphoenolpyruvate synthase [Clostridiales bacterium]
MIKINKYITYFNNFNDNTISNIGGKGINLVKLTKAGFPVPQGFFVTTSSYNKILSDNFKDMRVYFQRLELLTQDNLMEIKTISIQMRNYIENCKLSDEIKLEIINAWKKTGVNKFYAIRSSATAEDLTNASFAGQQDTFLNIQGQENILKSVLKCWSSLFTERAILYRIINGFNHESVAISVVIQEMIYPQVSGIMFTADPINGNRKVITIDASFGLGEALVSGIVTADLYKVKLDKIIKKQISKKDYAIYPLKDGGTVKEEIPIENKEKQALTDKQIMELSKIGREIENYYKQEQDIEWCLYNNKFYILQSRPITSLYPRPEIYDEVTHLFISFGHIQMMTDIIKPMGISVIKTAVPFGKLNNNNESTLLKEVGGRIYTDFTILLKYKFLQDNIPKIFSSIDEKIGHSLKKFIDRESFKKTNSNKKIITLFGVPNLFKFLRILLGIAVNIIFRNEKNLSAKMDSNFNELKGKIENLLENKHGVEKINELQKNVFCLVIKFLRIKMIKYVGSGIASYKLLEIFTYKWLGTKENLSKISKSPDNNVTTEIGLMIGDISEKIKGKTKIIKILENSSDVEFWDNINSIEDKEIVSMIKRFFKIYGMRGTGEIDITRPRWNDNPTQVVKLIMSYVKNSDLQNPRTEFKNGKSIAKEYSEELINKIRKCSFGFIKVVIIKRLIKAHRNYIGLREHSKFFIVKILDIMKSEILEEAKILKNKNIIDNVEDIYWLSLSEIKDLISTGKMPYDLIKERKVLYSNYENLKPPRTITSDGEIITSLIQNNVPKGAIAGTAASSGIIKGRARVVLKLEEADVKKGDILVAPYTDPAWTSLFPIISGVVTEVGGLMTHGSVVAREYGIPAVVGVDNVTKLIKNNSEIIINGNEGYIEIL